VKKNLFPLTNQKKYNNLLIKIKLKLRLRVTSHAAPLTTYIKLE
jgi:hypothetical protein